MRKEHAMKTIILSSTVLGLLAVLPASASASDLSVFLRSLSYGGHHVARQNHARHHDDLDHRAFHRELVHNEAHRYPMSYRQHGRLHDSLNHEAYHDYLEHRSAHRTRAYRPSYGYGGSVYRYPSNGCQSVPFGRSGISFSYGY